MSPHRLLIAFAASACLAAVPLAAADAAAPSGKQRADKAVAVLKSDAPLSEKYAACRELAAVGDAACVKVLAGLLADEKLSHMARYALEPMPGASADAALRGALGKVKGELLVGVIASIGLRRDAKAADALATLLKSPDARVAAAAAEALARIASPQAVRALADFREAAPDALRPAAADASLLAAERLRELGRADDAAPIYEALRAAKWPPHVRLGAFVGLLAARPDDAPARVVAALAGKDRTLRAAAISRIAALKGEHVAARFAAELPALPADAQVLVIGALAARGDAAARPAVLKAATHADARVRTAALRALGVLGDASCVALLCKAAAAGKTDAEKRTAAAGLRALRADGVDAAIVRSIADAGAALRTQLIEILVDRKATDAVDDLMKLTEDKDAGVRAAAFRALGRLAPPGRLPALLKLLAGARDEAVRREAENAVAAACRRIADPPARADAVLAALDAAAPAARCSLVRVLGGVGGAKALAAVRASLTSKDAKVRDAAVRALAGWPDAAALDALRGIVRSGESRTHRVLALRGCVRLLGLGRRPAEEALAIYADLLARAGRPEDAKLIIAGIAELGDPAALEALEPLLAKPGVGREAELAFLKVARAIVGSARSQAKAAARKLMQQSKSQAVRRQAAALLRRAEQFEDYITAWQAAGPYEPGAKLGPDLFRAVLPAEKPGAKGVQWRLLTADAKGDRPWMMELHRVFGGANRACCVRTWVHSPVEQPALLEFGTDDGSKVWLNGKLVHADATGGAAVPGEHKVRVTLRKGWNALLMKITQISGPWEFCLRVRKADGGPLPGLRVRAAPPQ